MYYAYVLKSVHHNYYYKGHCNNLERRLAEHNFLLAVPCMAQAFVAQLITAFRKTQNDVIVKN
jgi:predicted GIY-YIG superfamily endonuclease